MGGKSSRSVIVFIDERLVVGLLVNFNGCCNRVGSKGHHGARTVTRKRWMSR